jgi:hypothetical protein
VEPRFFWRTTVKLTVATAVALVLTGSVNAAAQDANVKIAFEGGSVYLVAEALASDVLSEWARVGKTEIWGASLLADQKLSLAVKGISEPDALRLILGEKYSFVGSVKAESMPGTSEYAVLRIDTLEALLEAQKAAASQPESRYEYLTPEKALWNDLGKFEAPESDPAPLVSERTYVYYTPEKAGLVAVPVDVDLNVELPQGDPENRYSYYNSGDVYDIPMASTFLYPIKLYRYAVGDPETRYTYYIPPKAMP